MKSRHIRYLAGGSALAIIALTTGTGTLAQQVTNAQSVMVNLELNGSFVLVRDEVWTFVPDEAVAFYSNEHNGTVVHSCSGAGCGSPAPATPPAPDPLDSETTAAAQADKCIFFAGGLLPELRTYERDVRIRSGSGGTTRNDRWRYVYEITPDTGNEAGRVNSRTAWELQSESVEPGMAELSGWIASQSVQARSRANPGNPFTLKYSHTITDKQGGSRVTDLMAVLTTPSGDVEITQLDSVLETNVDFLYSRTLGFSNGPTELLIDDFKVSEIHNGVAESGTPVTNGQGRADDFAGNDATLGERVHIEPVVFDLSKAGTYGLAVSGTVKGVSGQTTDQEFSVAETLTVDAEGCTP